MIDRPTLPPPLTEMSLPEPKPGATLENYVGSLVSAHTPYNIATNPTDAEAASNASLGTRLDEITRDWRRARRALEGVMPRWFSMTQIGVGSVAEIVGCWRLFEELGVASWPAFVLGTMLALGLITLAMLVSRAAKATRRGFWAAVAILSLIAISIGVLRAGELKGDDEEPQVAVLARLVLLVAATFGPPLLIESASRSLRENGAAFDHVADLKDERDEIADRLASGQHYIAKHIDIDQRHAEQVQNVTAAALAKYPNHFPANAPTKEDDDV